MLKLATNEGVFKGQELNVLFPGKSLTIISLTEVLLSIGVTACGDLNSVITTIANLPDDFTGTCRVVINDRDFLTIARSTLFLMIAVRCQPQVAAEMILHLWYSPLITKEMSWKLRSEFIIQMHGIFFKASNDPNNLMQEHTWRTGTSELQATLTNKQWLHLFNDFFVSHLNMTAEQAMELRSSVMASEITTDEFEFHCFEHPPGWRVSRKRFREEGMLLPFGASRDAFTVPNP